ncbi:pyrroloquinoline quinone biosynthesis peptide chaperone PqqD [Actinokineospora auranticolor]|uniref:Pyrroloquinoline quinone biosynthesis protein D n=1 Tax=Actinokineospora auranticolor TaxID=155976 RepID=A0A2S6GPM1_9PSEU|nr:pyrroloquinoline quinone biosynthesis peptide chaperone PqqD [Actinokineospora auranticolor]PPK67202.1 pyrroloquinoline quinone biosynthesis protein D [Actinokineospora auranticolor]
MPAVTAVPRLRRGVRLGYDPVRQSPVVLFPEGVLLLNTTAEAVLKLCDGLSSLDEIVTGLREQFTGVREDQVGAVLEFLADRHVVSWEDV